MARDGAHPGDRETPASPGNQESPSHSPFRLKTYIHAFSTIVLQPIDLYVCTAIMYLWSVKVGSDESQSQPTTEGLPPNGRVVRRLCREPCQSWTHEGAMRSVRCTRLDTAGNRGFSGASKMPGADVWRRSETSRGLDPDG